ncbi:MAG: hypothetical protein ACC656_03365, partial [Candidatus Heimdallarchaeota archaeon]
IKIRTASELDLFKSVQAIWNFLYQYQYFDFEHSFLRINAFMKLPDNDQTTIIRDIKMETSIYPEQKFTINVETYYPLYGETEYIPAVKKTLFKQYTWKLAGSGTEAATIKNQYPQPGTVSGLPDSNSPSSKEC